jgi:hypothetical protein
MDEGVVKKRNEYTRENLLKDLRLSEPSDFQNFPRLDATSFDEQLKMVTSRIEKKGILLREMLFFQASFCQLHYSLYICEAAVHIVNFFYSVAVILALDIPQSR